MGEASLTIREPQLMKTRLTAAFLCLLSAAAYADLGEDDDLVGLYDDEELITIATGTEKQVRFAPSVASVITSRDIRESGARTLDEALEMVPGLHVGASFNRQDAIYSIRGIHTGQNPQVLLLIDGIRVQQLFSGARPYNYSLPVANIERIEVIRGPGSAVYGADAFAGVISVTTKTANHTAGNEVGVRRGSFATREVWWNFSDEFAGVKTSFSIQHTKSDGDDRRRIDEDFQTILDGLFATDVSLAPGQLNNDIELLNSKLKFSGSLFSLDFFSWHLANAGNGSGGAQALDPEGGDSIDYSGVSLVTREFQLGSEDWTLLGELDYSVLNQDARFRLFPPGAVQLDNGAPPTPVLFPDGVIGNPSVLEKTIAAEVVSFYRGSSNHNVRIAAGFRLQDLEAGETKNFSDLDDDAFFGTLIDVSGTQDIFIRDENREHYYISVQDEWAFANDWRFTFGLRYDKFTQFGDSVNPRAALVWSTTHNLTTKVLYGRAFRAPSFSELFADNNPALLGNEDLDPETINTYEVAFDYRPTQRLALRLNLFAYDIKDLVEIEFQSPASNSGEQSGKGFEFELEWDPVENLRVTANYAWQRAEDDENNRDVANAPQEQIYFRAAYDISNSMLGSVVVNHVMDRERPEGDSRSAIDDYTTLDAVLSYQNVYQGLDIALIGRNLFDVDVREPSSVGPFGVEIPQDYPMEGRSATIEVTYHFDR